MMSLRPVIAERLSARQLIVRCGGAYVRVYMYVSRLGMQFRGPPGGKRVFKMASPPVTRILTCTSGARRIRDLDKSITSFYQGWLTTAPTRFEFRVVSV